MDLTTSRWLTIAITALLQIWDPAHPLSLTLGLINSLMETGTSQGIITMISTFTTGIDSSSFTAMEQATRVT